MRIPFIRFTYFSFAALRQKAMTNRTRRFEKSRSIIPLFSFSRRVILSCAYQVKRHRRMHSCILNCFSHDFSYTTHPSCKNPSTHAHTHMCIKISLIIHTLSITIGNVLRLIQKALREHHRTCGTLMSREHQIAPREQ